VAHSDYFIEIVETNATRLKQFANLKKLEAEHPNILNALDYLVESQEVVKAFRLGSNIWKAWWRWGYLSQGRQWLNKILALPDADTKIDLAMYQSDYPTAKTYFEQSLEIWRERGNSLGLGRVISGLAGTYRSLGDYELALKLNYECIELYRKLGGEASIADSLCNTAWQLMERGNYEQVQTMLEESLALHTKANYFSGMGRAKIYLGDFLWRINKPAEAIQHLEEAILLLKHVNHQIRIPTLLYRLGLIYLCQGQMDLAQKYLEESVKTAEEMYTPLDLTYAYSCLGLLRLVQHNLIEAQSLFEKAISYRSEIGQPEGIMWAMEGMALVALEQGNPDFAQQMIAEAQLLREEISAPRLPHTLKFIEPKLLNLPKPEVKALPPVKPGSGVATRKVENGVAVSADQATECNLNISEREKEVLQLVAQGYRNVQIAELLVITPGTVNNHLTSVYSKLGVNSRTAAVRYALDHDLLQA
jgi:DNA-binding CsgD family transcriptional regulator